MPNWRQVGTLWAYVQLEISPKVDAVYFQGLARRSRRVRRRFVCGSREISLVPSLLRASTDALTNGKSFLQNEVDGLKHQKGRRPWLQQ